MIFYGDPLLRPPPDDLTVPQFILDHDHLERPIRKTGHPWLIEDQTGKTYGYKEICTRVQCLASALNAKFNIKEDDVVCLFSPNHMDYPIAIWAVHRLGGIITTANPAFSTGELVHQLMTTQATIVITDPALEGIAIDAGHQGSPKIFVEDLIACAQARPLSFKERKLQCGEAKTKLAFLSFSSGTTGKPKAVAIPHYSLVANMLQIAIFNRIADPTYNVPWDKKRFRPGDVAAGVIPLYHIYGLLVNLHFMLFAGLTVVVTPTFVFAEMLQSIERHKITHALIVPPQVVFFCKNPTVKEYDLSSLRYVIVAAASLSREMTLQLQSVLPHSEIGQGYGMTETCTAISMFPLSQRLGTPGSVGHLIPGVKAKVVTKDGTLCGYNEPGELFVAGPQMALGYFDNAQATKETFIDGWVRTGDEVIIREDGDIFIVDRLKEIFKVRGFQVAPAELEGHLLTHPDVNEVGVVGVSDAYSGDIPMAFISLSADAAIKVQNNPQENDRIKASIIKHVADAKARYKWLAGGVEFMETIPKNSAGKVLRRVLRDRAAEIMAQRRSSEEATAAKL